MRSWDEVCTCVEGSRFLSCHLSLILVLQSGEIRLNYQGCSCCNWEKAKLASKSLSNLELEDYTAYTFLSNICIISARAGAERGFSQACMC